MAENRNYNKKPVSSSPVSPNEFGKLPPQAPELEEDVLGAIMLEKDAYASIADILKPDFFYKTAHQKIYEAVVDLALHQNPIDMHTVTEMLRKKGTLDDVGGPYYITLLTSRVSSAATSFITRRLLFRSTLPVNSSVWPAMYRPKPLMKKWMWMI